jgi:hypothetical protein
MSEKLREFTSEEEKQIAKGLLLLEKLMIENPQVERKIWGVILIKAVVFGYRGAGISYEELEENLIAHLKFYKENEVRLDE